MTENKKRKSSEYRESLKKRINKSGMQNSEISHNRIITSNKKNSINYKKIAMYSGAVIIGLSVFYLSFSAYNIFFQKRENVISIKNSNVEVENEDLSAKEKFNKFENTKIDVPVNTTYVNKDLLLLNHSEREIIRSVLANYDLSTDVKLKARDKNYSIDALYEYLSGSVKVINGKEKDFIINGYTFDYPISINKFGVVDSLSSYSTPWRLGVNVFDKLIAINGQRLNPNAKIEDVRNAIFNPNYKSLTWYNSSKNTKINTITFKKEALFGDLATIRNYGNDGLFLDIKKMTSYTPKLIAQLIDTYGKNKKGIIINLNNVSDFSYNGIGEMVWLFNGQKVRPIAEVTNYKGENEKINSVPFNVSQTTLNTINNLERIILVNGETAGSAEVFAGSIPGVINGYTTKGGDEKYSYYKINEENLIRLSNGIVKNSDGKSIQLKPKFNKIIVY